MLNISYTISSRLKEYLARIEDLRKQILLTPISQENQLRLRWEATSNRIYACLKLSGNTLSKNDMLETLAKINRRKMSENENEVLKYKRALDSISQNWLGSKNFVEAKDIIQLHEIVDGGKMRVPSAGLQHLLNYLQIKSQNPIIQAAIAGIEMEKMQLFLKANKLIANLTSLIFLHKYGYDFNGFLVYETAWLENDYRLNHDQALNSASLTLWLEYFALCILRQAENLIHALERPKTQSRDLRKSFWKLNERQKSILACLDQPQAAITNRQVQKHFNTSQITASRDLTKLTNLGLLFSHGKGRSVYYTKI